MVKGINPQSLAALVEKFGRLEVYLMTGLTKDQLNELIKIGTQKRVWR